MRSEWASDRQLAQRNALETLRFIHHNKSKLSSLRNGAKYISAVEDIYNRYNDGSIQMSEKVLSYIDGLYEKTMKSMGFESVQRKHDFVKKTRN